MENYENVLVGTIAVAILCISFSTWVTLSDLRAVVFEGEGDDGLVHGSDRSFAQAIQTIDRPLHRQKSASATRSANVRTDKQLAESWGQCYVQEHTDHYGEAVKPGPFNVQPSAAACCDSCLQFKPKTANDSPCNVWVWCGDEEKCKENYQHCWLKYMPWLYSSKPKQGPEVAWTTGLTQAPPASSTQSPTELGGAKRRYHTVTTAQGATTHWQMRIHYYWFKKQQKKCHELYGDSCHMGGFTRILHSGRDDDLSAEIPTYVARPLPSGPGNYVVLNRPYAFLQWVKDIQIKEEYILMSEPDHIFMRPVPNLMIENNPAAFPFFYIEPSRKDFVPITQKFVGKDKDRKECESIAPIGSSPTFMRFDDLQQSVEAWVNTSIAIFEDPVSNKEWGWVMEMYAFTISLYNNGIGPVSLHLELAAQPPWDTTMSVNGNDYYILHYTYGMDYTLAGVFTPGVFGQWRFDKRSYAFKPPPRNLADPPAGMENDLVRFLIKAINEATDAIPGWDEYSKTGMATEFMKYDE
eukprot:jgi/Ulvmu1/8966/UM005_0057.1